MKLPFRRHDDPPRHDDDNRNILTLTTATFFRPVSYIHWCPNVACSNVAVQMTELKGTTKRNIGAVNEAPVAAGTLFHRTTNYDQRAVVYSGYRRHRIKLRTFDGTTPFETFSAHFDNCCSYYRWKEVDKLAHLKASLTGNVGQILWDSDPSATDSLPKLTALLHSRYSGNRQSDKYRMELRLRRR